QGEALAQINLGGVFCQVGAYGEAAVSLQEALHICQEIGDLQSESWARLYLADLDIALGDYAAAQNQLEKTMAFSREMGDRAGEGWALCNLSLILLHLGDLPTALSLAQAAQQIGQELHHLPLQAATNLHLGHILVSLGDFATAAEMYETAVTHHRQLGQQHLAVEGVAGQARAALEQGQLALAQMWVEGLLHQAGLDWEHGLPGTEEPLRIYFTCYRVLAANEDVRAGELLARAHRFLQQRAAQIADSQQRNLYLHQVATHRAIQSELAKLRTAI
ncbi:MAG: tetratricopeptide repeat protein, partial [Anaerolineales bacterium]|nr:tetratricopeptide repeat protein [Anaerolineales bacterium]